MTYLEQMNFALNLHFEGKAAVLIDKNGNVLHRQETLDMKLDPNEYAIIRDIDITLEGWRGSTYALTLESVWHKWLENRKR